MQLYEAEDAGWSVAEQQLLEQGLKKFSRDLKEERWVKIAGAIDGRTAEDCKNRFKELAKAIKAKKEMAHKLAGNRKRLNVPVVKRKTLDTSSRRCPGKR